MRSTASRKISNPKRHSRLRVDRSSCVVVTPDPHGANLERFAQRAVGHLTLSRILTAAVVSSSSLQGATAGDAARSPWESPARRDFALVQCCNEIHIRRLYQGSSCLDERGRRGTPVRPFARDRWRCGDHSPGTAVGGPSGVRGVRVPEGRRCAAPGAGNGLASGAGVRGPEDGAQCRHLRTYL